MSDVTMVKVEDVEKDGKPWKRITWRENGEPCEITIREGGPQSVEQIVKDIETRQKRRESKPGYYHSDDRDQT